MWRLWFPIYRIALRGFHYHIGWLWRRGPKARRLARERH